MGPVKSHFAKTYCNVQIHLLYWLYQLFIYEGGIKMTSEKCRSKRRCLLSSLQGSSPIARIKPPCNDRRVWKTNEEIFC